MRYRMISKLVNRALGIVFLITIFLVFNFNVNAQDQEIQMHSEDEGFKQTANELTLNLSQRVNLTEEQREEITDVLVDYQKEIAEIDPNMEEVDRNGKISEIDNGINEEITAILDDNQMVAFDSYKDQWFQEVRTRVHSASGFPEDQDKQY